MAERDGWQQADTGLYRIFRRTDGATVLMAPGDQHAIPWIAQFPGGSSLLGLPDGKASFGEIRRFLTAEEAIDAFEAVERSREVSNV